MGQTDLGHPHWFCTIWNFILVRDGQCFDTRQFPSSVFCFILKADFYQTISLALLSCLPSQVLHLLKAMLQENEILESRTWGVMVDLGKYKTFLQLARVYLVSKNDFIFCVGFYLQNSHLFNFVSFYQIFVQEKVKAKLKK